VSQQCRWKFMVFGGAFPCHLAVKEQPRGGTWRWRCTRRGSSGSLKGRGR
jgi:hypothetical protein